MKKSRIALALVMALGLTMTYGVKGNCAVYNGWEQSNGCWYYYKNGSMCTGWQNEGGTWYYMNSNGTMKTGWLKDSGSWYYLDKNGSMKTGWIKDGGSWYYLNSNGAMATGWINDGSEWYYLDGSGAMKTGWVKDGGKWYYLESDGTMRTGWLETSETRYFLNDDGSMATGWAHAMPGWYYFNEDGTPASDITVDGYYISSDGMWDSSFDGEVRLKAEKSSYYINNTKFIDFSIINYKHEKVQYKLDYTVEKEVGFRWTDVPLNDASVSDTVYEINPGERKVISIPLSSIDEKLSADSYKIRMKFGDEYVNGYFDLSNDNVITLKAENNGGIQPGDRKIQYTITNNSDQEVSYGREYKIQKLDYPDWVDVKLKNDIFTEDTIILKPHSTNTETIYFDNLSDYDEFEEYRIVKVIDGNEYYDIFGLQDQIANDDKAE